MTLNYMYPLSLTSILESTCLIPQKHMSAYSMRLNAKYCETEMLNIGQVRNRNTFSDITVKFDGFNVTKLDIYTFWCWICLHHLNQ